MNEWILKNELDLKQVPSSRKMSTLCYFSTQHSNGSPNQCNEARKRRGIWTKNDYIKVPLFADDITVQVQNPKEPTKNYYKMCI